MGPFIPSRKKAQDAADAAAAVASSAQNALGGPSQAAAQSQLAARAPGQEYNGAWLFAALCINLKVSEYEAFGFHLGEDTYVPRAYRARWSSALEKRFEKEPLLEVLPGESFRLTSDRQQRALLVCSHFILCDHDIDSHSYEQMLLKVCQKLGDGTLTHRTAAPQPTTISEAPSVPLTQEQQISRQRPITIRSSKGDFLRSGKMHFKADVPVAPYLAFLYAKYGIAPASRSGVTPLDPHNVNIMQERAEDDTRPFWPVLHEPAFRNSLDHSQLGGLHLSSPVLLTAGFTCLPVHLQPEGCGGTWWAHSKSPLLVFLAAAGQSSGNTPQASCSNGYSMYPSSPSSENTSGSVHVSASPPPLTELSLSGLSLSDAAQSQNSIAGASSSPSTAATVEPETGAAEPAAAVAEAVGAVGAPAAMPASGLLTAGQVYDELARFKHHFMANKTVTGCSVCMVPCLIKG